jgi:ABC-type sulfate/molybdate transport systems ATPase subunit
VLLLDEPAAGLDAQSRSAFFADLEQALAGRATTVVHVSHRAEEALRIADRVVVLVDGRVRQVGSPDVLNRFPADAAVAALVGYENLVDAYVETDASVLVGQVRTGLTHGELTGPVVVAVFANGVRIVGPDDPGIPVRVTRITPGPGHRAVALEGSVSLLARMPVNGSSLSVGDEVEVDFDPALAAVLPKATG